MPKTQEKVHKSVRLPKECIDFVEKIDPENFNEGIIKALQIAKENNEKGIESTIEVREPFETDLNQDDFGAFACPFRKPHDATTYLCFSRNPMVRVPHDGTIPKDICRLCERLQTEQRFLTQTTTTKSGEVFKEYLINDKESKRQEKLDFLRKKEAIKIEAMKQRQKIKEENRRVQVNYDGNDPNGVGFDSSELGDGYF